MLLALDVAIILPADIAQRAVDLSTALPREQSLGLQLDDRHIPHITLAQAFVDDTDLERLMAAAGDAAVRAQPLQLEITGGARSQSSVSLAIGRTAALQALHVVVMHALDPFARHCGDAAACAAAFADGDARPRDVAWVTNFRAESSFDRYSPHVTLGHADRPPEVEPVLFTASRVAACHLGRFCSCREILRSWWLS
jgi:hypothetical protein